MVQLIYYRPLIWFWQRPFCHLTVSLRSTHNPMLQIQKNTMQHTPWTSANTYDKIWHVGLSIKIIQCLPSPFHNFIQSYLLHGYFRPTSLPKLGVEHDSVLEPLFIEHIWLSHYQIHHNETLFGRQALLATKESPLAIPSSLQESVFRMESTPRNGKQK